MTVIVALVDGDRTIIGSDGLRTNGEVATITGRSIQKWRRCGRWRISHAGWATPWKLFGRPGSLIAEANPPAGEAGAWQVAALIRAELLAHGWHTEPMEGAGPLNFGTHFILSAPGELWIVGNDLAVERVDRGFIGDGAGEDYALGALDLALGLGLDGEAAVRAALETACRLSAACGGELFMEILQ